MRPKAIVDPHPRTLELLFNKEDLERLKSLVTTTVWEGGRMPAAAPAPASGAGGRGPLQGQAGQAMREGKPWRG